MLSLIKAKLPYKKILKTPVFLGAVLLLLIALSILSFLILKQDQEVLSEKTQAENTKAKNTNPTPIHSPTTTASLSATPKIVTNSKTTPTPTGKQTQQLSVSGNTTNTGNSNNNSGGGSNTNSTVQVVVTATPIPTPTATLTPENTPTPTPNTLPLEASLSVERSTTSDGMHHVTATVTANKLLSHCSFTIGMITSRSNDNLNSTSCSQSAALSSKPPKVTATIRTPEGEEKTLEHN